MSKFGDGLAPSEAQQQYNSKITSPSGPSAVITEFQTDAVEIEEAAPPRLARATLYVVVAFLVGALSWAYVSKVDRVVVATGKLVATKPNLLVHALETSIVRTIDVVPGDVVRAGETLATLDPTFAQSDVAQLRSRAATYEAELDRLKAEIVGKPYVVADANEDELLQTVVYRQRRAFYEAEIRNFDERMGRIEASMTTNRSDQDALSARLKIVREIEGMRTELMNRQVGSRLSLLEARDARLEMEGRLEHLGDALTELAHELGTVRAERKKFIEAFRREMVEELVDRRADLQAVQKELNKADLRRRMVELTSPTDAVVLDVAKLSIGSVVREAEPLFTLVQLDVPLEAEVSVDARDIGFITPNQEARIKFDAFPFQKHGTARGVIRVISEDAFTTEAETGSSPFYRARVRLTDAQLRDLPENFRLLPGMTTSAEINVGERTVLSYFLYPILRGLDESIREP